MPTVAEAVRNHKPIIHYAVYTCPNGAVIYGTAEVLVGYGYLFRADDDSWFEAMKPGNPNLEVCGLKEMADEQLAIDLARREAQWRGAA